MDRLSANLIITEPLGYLEMLNLIRHASKILTDKGRIQKEAYMLGVPCITLREKTEWVETIEKGWNVLVGVDRDNILNTINFFNPIDDLNDILRHYAIKKIANAIDK